MRYSRNRNMITSEEMAYLKKVKVAVIGCGGLGGYVIEMLARLGIGQLLCMDGDGFDVTNWNRQILSTEANENASKAFAAVDRVHLINSEIVVTGVDQMLTEENAHLLKGCDLVVDAVDQVETKVMLQDICETLEIPLIFGAIAGWYGQVATIYPKDRLLDYMYKSKKTIEKTLGNPSFTPATIASMQVAEGLKVLLKKEGVLRHQLLFVDLLSHDYDIITFR